MRKPLIVIAIALQACLASLVGFTPGAAQAASAYTAKDPTTISVVGLPCGALSALATYTGGHWQIICHNTLSPTPYKWTLDKMTGPDSAGNYSATLTPVPQSGTPGSPSGPVTIVGGGVKLQGSTPSKPGGNPPPPPTAAQAYTAVNPTTIHATGFPCGGLAFMLFTFTGNTWKGGCQGPVTRYQWTISNFTGPDAAGNYTATVTPDAGSPAPSGSITIKGNGVKLTLPTAPSTSDPGVNVPPSCNAETHFTWLICDTIRVAMEVVDWIRDNIIVPFLVEKPLDKNDPNVAPVFQIWTALRNIASVFFILVFFLVIFGTAIGFDNYSVKKTLPRLVIGAVLVPFSWYVCVLVIDVGNILGQGILALTSTLIPPAAIDFTSGFSKLLLGGVLIGATVAATTALATIGFGLVVTMVIAFFTVFFTLVLRKILIIIMVVLSPFAFLAWILPNTSKLFKEWWSNFFKLVMMYPVIMMLFEAGRLFAATAGTTAGNGAEKGVTPLFQLVGLTLPLFAVPFAFKWAGSGLDLGRKGIGKGMGALDQKFGKDSEGAKVRAETRRDNNARRATDTANNRIGGKKIGFDSKTLGAARRGFAMKRSGLGGFAGNSKIPILGNNAAKRQAVNSTAAHADHDLAESAALEQMRLTQPQPTKEAIHNATESMYGEMVERRITEDGASVKNQRGVALKDIAADGASEEHEAAVQSARLSLDKGALLAALQNSDGGVDNLEAIIMEQQMKGDTASTSTVAAALKRLNSGPGGIKRAQDMALGSYVKTTDANGKDHYHGGGGEGAILAADGSVVNTGKALLGGDYTSNVGDKWRDAWQRGMKDSMSVDTKKSLAQAAVDMSSAEMATYTIYDVERRLAMYDQGRTSSNAVVRKAAIKGATDFDTAARGIEASPLLTGKTYSGTKQAIADSANLSHPIVGTGTQDYFQALVAAPAVAPTIEPVLAEHIVAATDNDPVHASQIKAQIDAERAAGAGVSALHDQLAAHVESKGEIDAADLAAAGAAKAAMAAGEVAPPAALAAKMAQQWSGNLDQLHEVERRYAQDEKYRGMVEGAYLRDTKIPPPPAK